MMKKSNKRSKKLSMLKAVKLDTLMMKGIKGGHVPAGEKMKELGDF